MITVQMDDIPNVSRSPISAYCRKLIADGTDPATEMHVYRGEVLALKISEIGKAARLAVSEDRGRPRFVAYKPFRGTTSDPPMRSEAHAGVWYP